MLLLKIDSTFLQTFSFFHPFKSLFVLKSEISVYINTYTYMVVHSLINVCTLFSMFPRWCYINVMLAYSLYFYFCLTYIFRIEGGEPKFTDYNITHSKRVTSSVLSSASHSRYILYFQFFFLCKYVKSG